MESNKVILSGDGSHTVVSNKFGVSYHSLHGALEESCHIFISAGLYYQYLQGKREINIFEMGFGTGLNAWLAMVESSRLSSNVNYEGIELFPVEQELVNRLNYPNLIEVSEEEKTNYYKLHNLSWDESHIINNSFTFRKEKEDIQNFNFKANKYDVIFFDAFAPNTQDYLWEKPLHLKIYKALKPGGILVSYCAKGVFKRMLKEIGYRLDVLNGPGRKHEMTRAVKIA